MTDANNTFNKILDALIDEAIPIAESTPDYDLPEEKPVELSEDFDKRIRRMFAKERGKQRAKNIVGISRRVAACFALLILASAVTVFSVEAFRVKVLNFILNGDKTNMEIRVDGDGDVVSHGEGYSFSLGYIPSGFSLEKSKATENMFYMKYKSDDRYFDVTANSAGGLESIDYTVNSPGGPESNERGDAGMEKMTVNGLETLYFENEGADTKTLVMQDGDRIYTLSGNIDKDQIIQIAQNLNIKN